MNLRRIAELARADPGLAARIEQVNALSLREDPAAEPVAAKVEGLELRPSPRGGIGVFAATDFDPDATVEVCPCLEIEEGSTEGTRLDDRVFGSLRKGKVQVMFGFGMLYNHSASPTLHYEELEPGLVRFYAVEAIAAGTELTIDYGDVWWSSRELEPLEPGVATPEAG